MLVAEEAYAKSLWQECMGQGKRIRKGQCGWSLGSHGLMGRQGHLLDRAVLAVRTAETLL